MIRRIALLALLSGCVSRNTPEEPLHPPAALAVLAASALSPQTRVEAGDLQIAIRRTGDGIRISDAVDLATGRCLSSDDVPPLFTIALRHRSTARVLTLQADSGWEEVRTSKRQSTVQLQWTRRAEPTLTVLVHAQLDDLHSAIRWRLALADLPDGWYPTSIVFPQIAVSNFNSVFYPQGPGRVSALDAGKPFLWQGLYPSGWTTMQFMAAYDRAAGTGFYVSANDPNGGLFTMTAQHEPNARRLLLAFDHLPSAERSMTLSGAAVWQILRGDWYDAASIYRDWARAEASWYPREKMTADGRANTPLWMRELCFWVLDFGGPKEVVDRVKAFQKFMGVPVGLHWYQWHQNPWDNDYPHFFPPKEGFAEGLADLQRSNVYAMPYINGRYWDTRDRGLEDREFKSVRPWAAKKEDGSLYLDNFGTVESDGSKVQFAVMCPMTGLWQSRVRSLTLKLLTEYQARSVYVDSIGAGAAVACYEPNHGHPVAGGTWWVEAHRRMMSDIRVAMPSDRALTTEDTSEVYMRGFDGFLAWDWMWDDMVPAFPVVYGGAVQLFGRAYYGGKPRDLAIRMKAAQQLVFGEQIGWIQPLVLNEPESASFLRDLVQLRYRYRRYFYAGTMLRPPSVPGAIPNVTADWHFLTGNVLITTRAVLAGAWTLEGRTLKIFVNVSDAPVTATFNGSDLTIPARSAMSIEK